MASKPQWCQHGPLRGGYCLRIGTREVDGRWYCWQHDPSRVKIAPALRQKHERIGRLVVENAEALRPWSRREPTRDYVEECARKAGQVILKEVDS